MKRVKNYKEPKREQIILKTKGQRKKSAGRMPRHQEPKKDVVSCEKLRGIANRYRSVDVRMRKLTYGSAYVSYTE